MYDSNRYKGEFKQERFRIFERPMYNKKMRRHLGLQQQPVRIVTTAKGFLGDKFIVRTKPVVHQEISPDGKYLRFTVEGGSWYQTQIPLNPISPIGDSK